MRRLAVPLFILAVAGCQPNEPPQTAPAPTLARPTYASAAPPHPTHPLSPAGQSYAPAYVPPQRYSSIPHPGSPAPGAGIPRGWIPAAPTRRWQYIVIHHSDTATGSAETFRRYHVETRHWQDLGYDFVIGNGSISGDGQVEVGGRWVRQETGAHAGVLKYNEFGIGICLVGDFEKTRPTSAQMQSLARLTAYLMRTYRISADRVIGHSDARNGGTNCPGRFMNLAQLRSMASRLVLADDPAFIAPTALARGELLREAR